MTYSWLLALYCLLLFLMSLLGGWLILIAHPTHARLQVALSFVSGLMLGIALLHFLPDAAAQLPSVESLTHWALFGFLAMFFLQRFFDFHSHDLPGGNSQDCCKHSHHDRGSRAGRFSWAGAALGMTLHSILDGVAVAAAFEAGARAHVALAGLGVALAVILHKPFDAMAISTLMTAGGRSRRSSHAINWILAFMSPLGVGLFYMGAAHFSGSISLFLGSALAFCAGTFLCTAGSDLMPELQFHTDRFKLSAALLLGVCLAALIGVLGG